MARKKMRKFSEGGEAARSAKINKRYDRKVADIDSDYKKALAKGKDAAVAKAKYEQRMADAADDRAKWTGGDRTATRTAERAAEKNLSMTRKYGARSSDTQVAKAEESLASKAPLSSVDTSSLSKPQKTSFKEAFAAARKNPEAMKAGKFTWNGKSYSTALAGAKKPTARPAARPAPKPAARPAPASTPKPAASEKKNEDIVVKAPPKGDERRRTYSSAESRERAGRMLGGLASAPFKAIAEYNPASLLLKAGMKKGGSVKGYAKGGKIDGCAVRGKTKAGRKK